METGVVVVGGGPAGLSVAARLRGVDALVLEASPRLGWPPHCTGIVSPAVAQGLTGLGLRGLASEEVLEAVYEEAVFLGPGAREACRLSGRPLAVKLARPGLEQLLASLAEARGHRVAAKAVAEAVQLRGARVAVTVRGAGVVEAHYAVLAQGRQRHTPRLPLPPGPCSSVPGVEERVVLTKRVPGEAFYTLHASRIAPGFFAWLAPVGDGREAVVGLATRAPGLAARLQAFKRLLERAGITGFSRVVSRRGGLVLRGPAAARAVEGNMAWIGDTLCASKPYTGGGLYAVSVLAPLLAEAIERGRLGAYGAAWRRLRLELLAQRAAADAAHAVGSLFLRLLAKACRAAEEGRCRIDYDRHTSLARCLLAGT